MLDSKSKQEIGSYWMVKIKWRVYWLCFRYRVWTPVGVIVMLNQNEIYSSSGDISTSCGPSSRALSHLFIFPFLLIEGSCTNQTSISPIIPSFNFTIILDPPVLEIEAQIKLVKINFFNFFYIILIYWY